MKDTLWCHPASSEISKEVRRHFSKILHEIRLKIVEIKVNVDLWLRRLDHRLRFWSSVL